MRCGRFAASCAKRRRCSSRWRWASARTRDLLGGQCRRAATAARFPIRTGLVMLWRESGKGWYQQPSPGEHARLAQQVVRSRTLPRTAISSRASRSRATTASGGVAAQVTETFLSVLGLRPQVGRALRPEETWRTGADVAVISDRLCAVALEATLACSSAVVHSMAARCRSSLHAAERRIPARGCGPLASDRRGRRQSRPTWFRRAH